MFRFSLFEKKGQLPIANSQKPGFVVRCSCFVVRFSFLVVRKKGQLPIANSQKPGFVGGRKSNCQELIAKSRCVLFLSFVLGAGQKGKGSLGYHLATGKGGVEYQEISDQLGVGDLNQLKLSFFLLDEHIALAFPLL